MPLNENIRDLYRDVSDFKKGYQPRTNIVMIMTVVIL